MGRGNRGNRKKKEDKVESNEKIEVEEKVESIKDDTNKDQEVATDNEVVESETPKEEVVVSMTQDIPEGTIVIETEEVAKTESTEAVVSETKELTTVPTTERSPDPVVEKKEEPKIATAVFITPSSVVTTNTEIIANNKEALSDRLDGKPYTIRDSIHDTFNRMIGQFDEKRGGDAMTSYRELMAMVNRRVALADAPTIKYTGLLVRVLFTSERCFNANNLNTLMTGMTPTDRKSLVAFITLVNSKEKLSSKMKAEMSVGFSANAITAILGK